MRGGGGERERERERETSLSIFIEFCEMISVHSYVCQYFSLKGQCHKIFYSDNTGGKFAEEGGPQISFANPQICRLSKFVKFANIPQVLHLWICSPYIFCDLDSKFLCRLNTSANLQILFFKYIANKNIQIPIDIN
jgi:hypothetical protein